MKRIAIGIILLVACVYSLAASASPEIEAAVDKRILTTDDTLQLKVTVRGGVDMTTPDMPSKGNFQVVGRSVSTSIEIVNGEMSSTKHFIYTLAPVKAGDFTIGPIKVFIEGQEYSAGPLAVKVTEGRAPNTYQTQGPVPGNQGFPNSPFGRNPFAGDPDWPFDDENQPPPQVPQPQSHGDGRDTFVTVDTDKKDAYVGEQIIYTFRFYSAVSLQGSSQLSLPEFKDFITEELMKEKKYQVDLNGRRYMVNEWRLAIFPTKAGKLYTGKTEVKANVPVPMGGGFSDPFFNGMVMSYRPKTFTGDSLPIEVKALPPPPADFSGLVGQFAMESQLNKNQLDLGQTASLKIELGGKGNIREATIPPLDFPKNLKVYPDQPTVKLDKNLTGLEGKKTFNYALVAERPGTVQLPPLEISYFNPLTQKYETLSAPGQTVAIRGSATQEQLVSAGIKANAPITAEDIKAKPRDLQPIADIPAVLTSQVSAPWESGISWALFVGSPSMYLLFLLGSKIRERSDAKSGDRKRSRAFRKAKSNLARLKSGQGNEIFGEVSNVVREYVGDRFAVSGRALTPHEIEALLNQRNISTETTRRLIYLLEQLDQWKYGGVPGSLPADKELKSEVLEMLRAVEREA